MTMKERISLKGRVLVKLKGLMIKPIERGSEPQTQKK